MSTPTTVTRPNPVEDPALRLFLVHHAGGSHLAFTDWLPLFPDDWDICPLEAPGRGRLAEVAPCTSVAGLAHRFAEDMGALTDAPFALFGHSMGGLVAHETALLLAERGRPTPVWVGVSACAPPAALLDGPQDGPPLHSLPGEQLRDALRQWDGMPPLLLADDRLWEWWEPRIRADFALVANRPSRPGPAGRLRVPLSLFGGLDDRMVPPDTLMSWSELADNLVGQHFFPGGHFYFTGQEAALVEQVVCEADMFR